ncbi:hypothetical protein DVH24_026558 [Malus domestica]|uniref:Autophagy-related protein n=1 Tax=Malus domestica TaxID=3750 RepID=A0A498KNZ1_MALDO|nr:hypothetical protein DVH24_026558 [Malus domestica]
MDSSMAAGKENSGSRSFENPQDIGRWLMQVLKENATARSAIPDLEEKKNSSHGKRKTVCKPLQSPFIFWTHGMIGIWDPMKRFKHLASLDAVKLREMRPDYIPVILKRDARSDIPDVDMRRCHVYDGTPLREFVHFLRGHIRSKKPIFVFFKNTKPPNSALMSAIHEENKDEDGFLYVTYSGEKSYINEDSRESMQAEQNNPDPIPKFAREKKEKSLCGHNEKCVCAFRPLESETIQDGRNISLHYICVIIIIFTSKAFSGYVVLIWASMHALSTSPSMSENMRKLVANSLFCFKCLDLYAIMDIGLLFIYLIKFQKD